jgi:hypothetical protein
MAWRLSWEPKTLWDLQEGTRRTFRRERRCLQLGQAGWCGAKAVAGTTHEPRCAKHAEPAIGAAGRSAHRGPVATKRRR